MRGTGGEAIVETCQKTSILTNSFRPESELGRLDSPDHVLRAFAYAVPHRPCGCELSSLTPATICDRRHALLRGPSGSQLELIPDSSTSTLSSPSMVTWSAIARALCCVLVWSSTAVAQDTLRADQYKSLKGLSELTLLVHQPEKPDAAFVSKLGLDPKALADLMTIAFARRAPKLHIGNETRSDKPYLEVSWAGTTTAVLVSISLWRSARLDSGNERTPAIVWDRRSLLLAPDQKAIRDSLDALVVAFAADYERANR